MSLFGALNIAVSSIGALNTGIRTVSDNIANSTNENYNARRAVFANNQFGGVEISDIERRTNDSLQRDLFTAQREATANGTRNRLYEQLEQLTGTISGSTPLSDAMENLRTAWKAFEAAPESNAAESEVILSGQSLVSEIERISNGLDTIESVAEQDAVDLVTELNEVLSEIDRLNTDIVGDKSAGRPTSALENLRDGQLERLSEIMDIKTFDRADGATVVYTTTGLDLSDAVASTFTYSTANGSLTKSGSPSTNLVTDGNLPDGELKAILDFIRQDFTGTSSNTEGVATIQKLRKQLDEFSFDLVDDATRQTVGTVGADPASDLVAAGTINAGDQFTIDVGAGATTITIGASDTLNDIATSLNAVANVRARVTAFDTLEISTVAGTTLTLDDTTGTPLQTLGLISTDPQTFAALDPPTLASAYNNATLGPDQSPAEAGNFFEVETGTTPDSVTRLNLRVNDTLSAGTEQLKKLSGNAVVEALNGNNRSFNGTGVSLTNKDYTSLLTGMLTDVTKQAEVVTRLTNTSTVLRDDLKNALRDELGVDIDEEVARLTIFQNSFAATARVIDATNRMLEQLENAAR